MFRAQEHGKLKLIDVPVFVSTRRVRIMGLKRTIEMYLRPTLRYLITKKIPTQKYKFTPASDME